MGCRICVEAPIDTMPLDLAVLLRGPGMTQCVVSLPLVDYGNNSIVNTQPSQSGCRRVATFPLASGHQPGKLSNLKYRWASECSYLHATVHSEYGHESMLSLLASENSQEHDSEERSSVVNIDGQQWDTRFEPLSPTSGKPKKKVAFADDRGLELATVKVMTEESDVPPNINYPAIMRGLFGEGWVDEEAVAKPCATWVLNFKQPASDYLAFREKLDKNVVAIENVLLKNDQCRLVGTVKVKNIYYEKDVFVRFTDNEWKSYYDRACKFVCSRGTCGANDSADTFQFDFQIPCDDSKHERIELCLCYKTGDGREYWDNHDGKNFEIISDNLRKQRNQTPQTNANGNGEEGNGKNTTSNPMGLGCTNWTGFAKWNHLTGADDPYW